MKRDLGALRARTFDVVIVGGGITGACLAHQLAARGTAVALVEKSDFGGFTSASSSKLLHGGIRYLQELRPAKVRESARERAYFQNVAPHLTQPVPFLLPAYKGSLMRGMWALRSAVFVYERLIAGQSDRIADSSKRIPRGPYLSAREVLDRAPELAHPSLTGAQVLHECQMISSERMTLAFLQTAASNGACIANYLRVEGFLIEDGRVRGVRVRDESVAASGGSGNGSSSFEIQARVVANSAGPHVPVLNRLLGGLGLERPTTGYSKGVHLVTRTINPRYALALVTSKRTAARVSRGGRHIFVIPWRGRSLIGTADVPFEGALDDVRPTETDVRDLLADVDTALPDARLRREDVHYAFAGLYPLTAREVRSDTYQGHGNYQILDHARADAMEGIVTVLGAKYTTAPRVAELAARIIAEKLSPGGIGPKEALGRDERPLDPSRFADFDSYLDTKQRELASVLSAETTEHLIRHYGTDIDELAARIGEEPELAEAVASDRPIVAAEIDHAASREMALTLEDAVFRRTGLGTIGHPGPAALRRCAARMARIHGWDEAQIRSEIERVDVRYAYAD